MDESAACRSVCLDQKGTGRDMAWLPPLNFSLQSAAVHQRDGVSMAHGRLRRGKCCQMAIL